MAGLSTAVYSGQQGEFNVNEVLSKFGISPQRLQYRALWGCAKPRLTKDGSINRTDLNKTDAYSAEHKLIIEVKKQDGGGSKDQAFFSHLLDAVMTEDLQHIEHYILVCTGSQAYSNRGEGIKMGLERTIAMLEDLRTHNDSYNKCKLYVVHLEELEGLLSTILPVSGK